MNERLKTFEEKMKKTIGNLDGDPDPAMGEKHGKRDRESNYDF